MQQLYLSDLRPWLVGFSGTNSETRFIADYQRSDLK